MPGADSAFPVLGRGTKWATGVLGRHSRRGIQGRGGTRGWTPLVYGFSSDSKDRVADARHVNAALNRRGRFLPESRSIPFCRLWSGANKSWLPVSFFCASTLIWSRSGRFEKCLVCFLSSSSDWATWEPLWPAVFAVPFRKARSSAWIRMPLDWKRSGQKASWSRHPPTGNWTLERWFWLSSRRSWNRQRWIFGQDWAKTPWWFPSWRECRCPD